MLTSKITIPDNLYEQLKQVAAAGRSINSEITVSIERALEGRRPSDEEMLEQVRALRERLKLEQPLTAEEIRRAIDEGRP